MGDPGTGACHGIDTIAWGSGHGEGRRVSTSRARIRPICADMTCRVPELGAHRFRRPRCREFPPARKVACHGMYASLTPRFAGGARRCLRPPRVGYSAARRRVGAGNALHPEFLPAAIPRPGVPREADDDRSRILAHQPRVQRRSRQPAAGAMPTPGRKRNSTLGGRASSRTTGCRQPRRWSLYDFLHHNFRKLTALHGPIYGTKIPNPKLFPPEAACRKSLSLRSGSHRERYELGGRWR